MSKPTIEDMRVTVECVRAALRQDDATLAFMCIESLGLDDLKTFCEAWEGDEPGVMWPKTKRAIHAELKRIFNASTTAAKAENESRKRATSLVCRSRHLMEFARNIADGWCIGVAEWAANDWPPERHTQEIEAELRAILGEIEGIPCEVRDIEAIRRHLEGKPPRFIEKPVYMGKGSWRMELVEKEASKTNEEPTT